MGDAIAIIPACDKIFKTMGGACTYPTCAVSGCGDFIKRMKTKLENARRPSNKRGLVKQRRKQRNRP